MLRMLHFTMLLPVAILSNHNPMDFLSLTKLAIIANTFGHLQEDTGVIPAALLTALVLLEVTWSSSCCLSAMIITSCEVGSPNKPSIIYNMVYTQPIHYGMEQDVMPLLITVTMMIHKPWFWQSLYEITGSDIELSSLALSKWIRLPCEYSTA